MRWLNLGLLLYTTLGILETPAWAGSWEIEGAETIRFGCRPSADGLEYRACDGEVWNLVTSVSDPAIRNPGAGAFFPIPERLVAEALEGLDARLRDGLSARIMLLPYPRRELLRSSCNGETIYLSPGVRPLSRAQVHCLLYHEIGHLLHRQLLPDEERIGWLAFEAALLEGGAPCGAVLQPHECFAESFRLLYGTPEARSVRPIGSDCVYAMRDRKALREFFEVLITAERARLYCASER